MRIPFCRLLASILVFVGSAQAQQGVELLRERAPVDRPALLVLGVAHFANPGRDVVSQQVDDVLSAKRQAEIEAVVEQLSRFNPTHVAVEWPANRQEALDARYRAYRQGKYTLSRNEVDQIGLRLAARQGLDRVIAADWNGQSPGDQAAYDWYEYGQSHGQSALVSAVIDPKRVLGQTELAGQTITSWLRALNEPSALAASHRNYFDIAMIGDAAEQPGAAWVGHWYARNLRIFANLERSASGRGDRVLAIYGAGHAHLLTQFANESGAFDVQPISQFLQENGRP